MVFFVVAAMLMLALAGRLFLLAAQTVWLHRHGERTTGTVISLWEDTDRDGPPQLRASIGFDPTDGSHGWLHVPARRLDGVLNAGDRLPLVYDPRHPTKAYVHPDGSPRLLVAAGITAALALCSVGFAGWLVWIGSGSI